MAGALGNPGAVTARGAAHAPTPRATPQAAVFSVTVISADRAAQVLRALFPRDRVRVDEHANAVIAVASPDDLAQMRAVLSGIDVRSPEHATVEVVQLHALKPASLIDRVAPLYPGARFEPASKSSVLIRATPQTMSEIKALITALDVAPPTVVPSPRPAETVRLTTTNPRTVARAIERQIPDVRASVSGANIVLVGNADDVTRAKALAQSLDAPPFGAKYTQVYRLHYVDATSVADLIARSFPNLHVAVDKDLNAISVFGSAAQQDRIAGAVAQLDASPTTSTSGSGGGPAYGDSNIDVVDLSAAMPGLNGAMSTSATDIASAVQQALGSMAPDLHITVPANSTEIVLAGSPNSIRMAKDLIARLDRPQPLVVLDTEVLEIDEQSARNIGLELPGAVLSTTFQEIQPTPNPLTGYPGKLIGLQPLTRTPLQFTAALNLLVQKGNARVLADPRVTTISGRTASIRAGDQIAVLTQTSGGVGTPVTQQIQTFNTGVTLDITPMVGKDDEVTVALHPVVNSLEGLVNGVPQIATRDTQTVVQLHDDQTLVIGGLIQETLQHTVSKIPILGDIPLLGRLFQNSDTESQRNELVIVVTPHILKPGEPAPPPNAVLAVPTPRVLPTLPPGTQLPHVDTRFPRPHPEPIPTVVPTPLPNGMTPAPNATAVRGPTLNTPIPSASPVPVPTPTAFASTNVFVYGSPPPNTYARDAATPQIYYVQFSPTLLRNGTLITVFAVTSSNVRKVEVGYPGYYTTLSPIGPSKWQATFNFNAGGLSSAQNTVPLNLNAYNAGGGSTTVQVPVSLTP